MGADIEDYKTGSSIRMVAILFRKMLDKWRDEYGEVTLADKFERGWSGKH